MTKTSFFRQKLQPILMLLVVCLLLSAGPSILGACDDTLLLILTAKDPNTEFSRSIREFNRHLGNLGAALLARQETLIPNLLETLMDSWLQFSGTFGLNPPEIAKNDAEWRDKIRRGGETIGLVRRLIREGKLQQAHDEVLAFNGRLGEFFSASELDLSKRLFLEASNHFAAMELAVVAAESDTLQRQAAALPQLLERYAQLLARQQTTLVAKVQASIASLTDHLHATSEINQTTAALVAQNKEQFMELRARILMTEWFPEPTQAAASQAQNTTPNQSEEPHDHAPSPALSPASRNTGEQQ